MKRIFFTMSLLMTLTLSTQAQSVYLEVKRLTQESLKSDTKSELEKSLAKFKIEALEYLAVMTSEQMKDSAAISIDSQSYGLYEFAYIYYNVVKNLRSKNAIDNVKKVFKNTSLEFPRFNEMDANIALKYINTKNSPTPFCLNTDWVKAVQTIKKKGYRYE